MNWQNSPGFVIIRVGRRKLHITTDEVGINFRWEQTPKRDERVIDGEIVTRKELEP